MGYQPIFKNWNSLTIQDLLIAYRKAKTDCFFENNFPTAMKFADYEQNLLDNLEELLTKLKKNNGFQDDSSLIGEFRLLPKKLSVKENMGFNSKDHIHFSEPKRVVKSFFNNYDITPEFRIIGDFPINAHIISALWINMIGHKYDAKLGSHCYSARLKRTIKDELSTEEYEKPFNISAIGSFYPYYHPYKKWRNNGFRTIREELDKKRDIIAVSLDLKSYYHFIDPNDITNDILTTSLDLKLSSEEKKFTKQLADFLSQWSNGASQFGKNFCNKDSTISGGLAIGLTCSRIISNVLLHAWDKLILEHLTPLYYGRYVDDMFLVLRDTGTINNKNDLMKMLRIRLGEEHFEIKTNTVNGTENVSIYPWSKPGMNTIISLQLDKQKMFILHEQTGLDFIDSIEKEISELSSERRFMPLPDQLEHSTTAKVLSATGMVGENADNLRKADSLTVRRLGWAIQLSQVEMLARDLPPHEWKKQRQEFYKFSHNHILRADNIFSYFIYLPRLLGFAVCINEWEQAIRITKKSFSAIKELALNIQTDSDIMINGCKAQVQNDF